MSHRNGIGIVGDVHGELECLRLLVDAAKDSVSSLIFAGDYINRGADSKGVIEYLLQLAASGFPCKFVEGNHDRAMRLALTNGEFDKFLLMGGAATVLSYVDAQSITSDICKQFERSVPASHREFLEGLDPFVTDGDLLVTHSERDLLSLPEFCSSASYVVVGHEVRRNLQPDVEERIARIDTGCGVLPDGRLTCLIYPRLEWMQSTSTGMIAR